MGTAISLFYQYQTRFQPLGKSLKKHIFKKNYNGIQIEEDSPHSQNLEENAPNLNKLNIF